MSLRQCAECTDEIPDLSLVGMDTDPFAEFLQHVYARPSVWRIYHKHHAPCRIEHTAQRTKASIGICKMMQDSRTNDLIETHPQVTYLFDSKLMDLEIL